MQQYCTIHLYIKALRFFSNHSVSKPVLRKILLLPLPALFFCDFLSLKVTSFISPSMASFEFDNVKAEKEDALWRDNVEKKLKVGLRLTGFLLAFFLLSWSWFPTVVPDTVEAAGDFLRRFVSTFDKPLFTFVLVNILILVVYVLSSQKQSQKQSTSPPDIYDEYVSSSRSMPTYAVATAAPATDETVVDKQIVLVENAVSLSPGKRLGTTVDTVTETKVSLLPLKQARTIGTSLTKTNPDVSSTEFNQKEYLRNRSMVPDSRNQRPRGYLRSETVISRKLVISGMEPPSKSMDEMSSEEFQLIVDSFIAERKKALLQENTAQHIRR